VPGQVAEEDVASWLQRQRQAPALADGERRDLADTADLLSLGPGRWQLSRRDARPQRDELVSIAPTLRTTKVTLPGAA
jgi:hypothetical protein